MGEREPISEFGPFVGIQELVANQRPGSFEALLNAELAEGEVRKRRGRKLYMALFSVFPTHFIVTRSGGDDAGSAGATAADDWVAEVSDGNTATSSGTLATANLRLYVSFARPVRNATFTLSTANTTVCTMTVEYWNGSAWTAVSGLSDGTRTVNDTISFGQSGTVSWTQPTDQVPIGLVFDGSTTVQRSRGGGGVHIGKGFDYPYRITFSATLSASTAVSACTSNLSAIKGEVNGAEEWIGPAGARKLILGMDDFTTGTGCLYEFDPRDGNFRALSMPVPQNSSGPGAFWRFVNVNGKLLCVNGFAPLLVYDGNDVYEVAKGDGSDSDSRDYGKPPPGAAYIALFQNQVVLAGGQLGNMVVFSLDDDAALLMSKDDATTGPGGVGGGNYWPVNNDLVALSPHGDEMTGLVVVGGNGDVGSVLLITKERSTFDFDGETLRLVSSDVGNIAPDSLQAFEDKAFFLSESGFYGYIGREVRYLPGLEKTLKQWVNRAAIRQVAAVIYRQKRQYRCWLPNAFATENNLCAVLHFETQAGAEGETWGWTLMGAPYWMTDAEKTTANVQEYEVRCAVSIGAVDEQETLLTFDYDGQIWVEDYGDDDNAKDIYFLLVSRRYGILKYGQREWHLNYIVARKEGEVTLDGWLLRDGRSWIGVLQGSAVEGEPGQVTLSENGDPEFGVSTNTAPGNHASLYGTDLWTTDEWREWRLSAPGGNGRFCQLMLRQADDNAPLKIRGFELEHAERGGKR